MRSIVKQVMLFSVTLALGLFIGTPFVWAEDAPDKMDTNNPPPENMSIGQAVSFSLKGHPQIKGAFESLETAKHDYQKAKGNYYPRLDLRGVYGPEWSDNPTTRGKGYSSLSLDRREAELIGRQLLFDGFGTPSLVKQKGATAESEVFKVVDTQEVLALRVAEAYMGLLLARDQLALADRNLEQKQRKLQEIESRSLSGVSNRSDVDQVQSRLAAATTIMINKNKELKVAEATFEEAIGVMVKGLEEPGDVTVKLPTALENAVERALANHPALKRRVKDVEAADAAISGAKSHFWPRFEVLGGVSRNRDVDGAEGEDNDARILLNMNINLFNGFADKSEVSRLNAVKRENEEGLKALRLVVTKNAKISWHQFEAAKDELASLERAAEADSSVAESFREQFNLARRTLFDVLNQEDAVYRSQAALLEGKANKLLAEYKVLAGEAALLDALEVRPEIAFPKSDVR